MGYPNKLEPTRLDILRQMASENPTNTFARYGLAMELVKSMDLVGAVDEFYKVVQIDETYSAAYYHGGQALEKLGRLDEARAFYRRGIGSAKDAHARGELQAALDILGD